MRFEQLLTRRFGATSIWTDYASSEIMIVIPRRPTLRRWLRFVRSPYSMFRMLVYERIEGIQLRGLTLDLGGGRVNSYHHLFDIQGRIDSVNIDTHRRPTYVADMNRPLPFRSNSFDHVICFNTLEHIHDADLALSEMLRVLKQGGSFHIAVPFLYPVHGDPDDFHRHTASWWEQYLGEIGVLSSQFAIEPLVWSQMASAFAMIESGRLRILRRFFRNLAMLLEILIYWRWHSSERQDSKVVQVNPKYALGYYIEGAKT